RLVIFFFFNDTATTEIYTLSLHDALPRRIDGACAIRSTGTRRPRGGPCSGPGDSAKLCFLESVGIPAMAFRVPKETRHREMVINSRGRRCRTMAPGQGRAGGPVRRVRPRM